MSFFFQIGINQCQIYTYKFADSNSNNINKTNKPKYYLDYILQKIIRTIDNIQNQYIGFFLRKKPKYNFCTLSISQPTFFPINPHSPEKSLHWIITAFTSLHKCVSKAVEND